ncbi:MAG: hypothetical protein IKP00_17035 [Victivallales bacterium]|nr:hypothetical protein [Victivallales bacterium]
MKRLIMGLIMLTTTAMTAGQSKQYGLRWEIGNSNDLGERCYDAIGMSATIGVGSTNGSSDFDSVYPWSEMKRCNIKLNENGAYNVTYEGEAGFALDGTNGDVFVRVPKFYYKRYRKDGYEYRVISESGSKVHPAFIENGKELDEIFISAFEGYKGSDDKLHSYGGVLPTCNLTAQTYLDLAQANGGNYSLYDMRCVDAVWNLMCIEYGCRNTNRFIGYGIADYVQPVNLYSYLLIAVAATNTNTVRTNKWTPSQKGLMPVGSNMTICDTYQQNILTQAKITACVDSGDYTDWTFDGKPIDVTPNCFVGSAACNTNFCESVPSGALSWHTGRAAWITGKAATTRNPIRYRWIENVCGNLWHYLPDVSFNALQMYVCNNMKDYVMHKITPPYLPVSTVFPENRSNGKKADVVGANYWITDLDYDPSAIGVSFGRSYDLNLTCDKAFGSYYYLSSNNVMIANGGGFDHLWRCNVLTLRAWITPDRKWYLYGARLMFKNLSH